MCTLNDIKEKIGPNALQIIVNGLNLEKRGEVFDCPYGDHQKGQSFSAKWYPVENKFYCHDCGRFYDIVDFAKTKNYPMQFLRELAGFTNKGKNTTGELKPLVRSCSKKGNAYLFSRQIAKESIYTYKCTSDDKWIYMHSIDEFGRLQKITKRHIGNVQNGMGKYSAVTGGAGILFGQHTYTGRQKILMITEGQLDALSVHTMFDKKQRDKICVCSIPNGVKSFKWLEESKNFLKNFEQFVLWGDNDPAGQEWVAEVRERMNGGQMVSVLTNSKDANEFLMNEFTGKFAFTKENTLPLQKELKGLAGVGEIKMPAEPFSINTGFLTHNYNDGGYKTGRLTLLTGVRGSGKTSYARQTALASVLKGVPTFVFSGESSAGHEKDQFARLVAAPNEIQYKMNIGGRKCFYATQDAHKKLCALGRETLFLSDCDMVRKNQKEETLFDSILENMKTLASDFGVKLFVLDNLMVFTNGSGSKVFDDQRRIATELKAFANKYNVHVLLIAHPRAGEGYQKISGAMELENMADTILRYVRCDKKTLSEAVEMPFEMAERVSAALLTEKIRDDGTAKIQPMEWDYEKGALFELVGDPYKKELAKQTQWVRYIENDEKIAV